MFDKIFSKKIVVPFFSGIGTVAIFQWIVFPGLTAADTLVNIFAGIIGFFTLVFVYYSLGIDSIVSNYTKSNELSDEQIKQKLESELGPVIDGMAKEVLKETKKKTTKKAATKSKTNKNK